MVTGGPWKVPQKGKPPIRRKVEARMKRWGKSPPVFLVTGQLGKPHALKDHVYRVFRIAGTWKARPPDAFRDPEGRSIDPVGNGGAR